MIQLRYPAATYLILIGTLGVGVYFLAATNELQFGLFVFFGGLFLFGIAPRNGMPDGRTLDRLLFDIAEHGRRQDVTSFYQRMKGKNVYARIVSMNKEVPPGTTIIVATDDEIKTECCGLPNGMKAAKFYVNADDPRLTLQHGIIPLTDALQFPLKTGDVDAVVFYNRDSSWLAATKDEIPDLLKMLS